MPGSYRRRVRLTSSPRRVVGEVEDDFHHFRVAVEHDGTAVTAVTGEAVRFPWDTCPSAAAALTGLVGVPLDPRATAAADHVAPRQNCTHMFDVAALAIAHATRDEPVRQYDATVTEGAGASRDATLERNGEVVLRWLIDAMTITEPPPFAGQKLRGRFIAWAEANLDADTAEAAIVFRRACEVSGGRAMDLDSLDDAGPLLEVMGGSCWSFQPSRQYVPVRMKGSIRDFSDRPDALLADSDD